MLSLYESKLEDLWFRAELMGDPETMSYNHAQGGTLPFPKEKWSAWYHKWIVQHGGQRYYRYLMDREADAFVGEIAYYLDCQRNLYIADIIVHARHRGRGYGTEGLRLLCGAAKENGLTALYDDIAIDNPSVHLFLHNGFTVDYQTEDIIMVKREL